jgi:hypothetical protein
MRGFRHGWVVVVAALILFLSLVLSGCSSSCTAEREVDERPIVQTKDTYSDEMYTTTETRVTGENCIERHYSEMNDSRFDLSIGEKEWLGEPIEGETNYLRRVVNVYNARDEIDTVYLDKIYKYNGTEYKRSRTPLKFLVDPESTRTLYLLWDTQYDPLKDLTADFTNNTEQLGFKTRVVRMCYNETEKVNVTKNRKVVSGTVDEVTGYDKVVKVKLKRGC